MGVKVRSQHFISAVLFCHIYISAFSFHFCFIIVHEVDPHVGTSSQRQTVIGGIGGEYESFAYDARDRMKPTFYVTHDSTSGGLVRFTPDPTVVAEAENTGDYSGMLTTMGTLHWLVLSPSDGTRSATSGTFQWTTIRNEADDNAYEYYRSSEGIDIRRGMLYFTTKYWKDLFILDLDTMAYTRSGTKSGAFDGEPDQIKRILADDDNRDMLYFCEEKACDNGGKYDQIYVCLHLSQLLHLRRWLTYVVKIVHARDQEGDFYSIIDGGHYSSETSGLAFSPDNKHMYISYQGYVAMFFVCLQVQDNHFTHF